MLKTIRSLIISLTVIMIFAFCILSLSFAYNTYILNKHLRLENCNVKIAHFTEELNNSIMMLEENATELAFMGKLFYLSNSKKSNILDYQVKEIFKNKKVAVGGGIWFEPYVIDKKVRSHFSYGFFTNRGIVLDKNYQNGINSYYDTSWYKELKAQFSMEKKVAWTTPYKDENGAKSLMTTVGAEIYDKEGKFIGLATVDWELAEIVGQISAFNPTENSFSLLVDRSSHSILATSITNTKDKTNNERIENAIKKVDWYDKNLVTIEVIKLDNVEHKIFVKELENGMTLVVCVPENELYSDIQLRFIMTSILLILSCLFIVNFVYYLLKKFISQPVKYLTEMATRISKGELDLELQIDNPEEFSIIADSFNKMKKDIQLHLENAAVTRTKRELLAKELSIAKNIQQSVLPSVYPAYPKHQEFRIYASMDPAQEVGGDFYDYYLLGRSKMVYLIADVSEKGIPAALLMMSLKSLIRDFAKTELSVEKGLEEVNRRFCETNPQKFFATLFLGVTDIITGETIFVNAGHNPPLIKRANGEFEYLKTVPNFVLGLRENIKYKVHKTVLEPNDAVLLYTDGVTEAISSDNEFYGEERFKQSLNKQYNEKNTDNSDKYVLKEIVDGVKADIVEFTQGREQSDDITLLLFNFLASKFETISVPARVEELSNINAWVDDISNKESFDQKHVNSLKVIMEEVFVNITDYAYPDREGTVKIDFVLKGNNELELKFIDDGKPFNPLEDTNKPNIMADAKDRVTGGYGIAMVLGLADDVKYEYIENKNIFTVRLKIN